MASSATFDSVELITSSYAPQKINHESSPERELNVFDLASEDGAIFVSEKYGKKIITIKGSLKALSQSALETAIDSFKELFSRKEKNLDISWAGGVRRYVATCISHNFSRDSYNINFVPWTAEFVISSGVGKDTTETAVVDSSAINLIADLDGSFTLAGSALPKPKITITFNDADWSAYGAKGIEFINNDTGERIVYNKSDGLENTKSLVFDCENKRVLYDDEEVSFYGVFPEFKIGSNSYTIRPGNIIDQSFEGENYDQERRIYGADNWTAFSFTVPFTDDTYQGFDVYACKVGSPASVLSLRIETDDAGKPSGDLVDADAYIDFSAGSFTTSYAWVSDVFAGMFSLTAGVRYWIVLKSVSADFSNCYMVQLAQGINATYKRGNVSTTEDAGSNWTANSWNIKFRLRYGGQRGGGAAILDVDYYKRYL
jgi:hypothetical protein